MRPTARQVVDSLLEGNYARRLASKGLLRGHAVMGGIDPDRILRAVVIDGYTVITWDTYSRREGTGHNYIGYRLVSPDGKVLFEGDRLGVPAGKAIDSDYTIKQVLSWLTLKPGDTDDEYFAGHTEDQLNWAQGEDAERLSIYGIEDEPVKFDDLPGFEHSDPDEDE
jgi:hypothetical protein